MKFAIAIAILAVGITANAENQFMVNGKPATKVEAVKALLANPGSNVIKACNVELTSKMTLRCKKATKVAAD